MGTVGILAGRGSRDAGQLVRAGCALTRPKFVCGRILRRNPERRMDGLEIEPGRRSRHHSEANVLRLVANKASRGFRT